MAHTLCHVCLEFHINWQFSANGTCFFNKSKGGLDGNHHEGFSVKRLNSQKLAAGIKLGVYCDNKLI